MKTNNTAQLEFLAGGLAAETAIAQPAASPTKTCHHQQDCFRHDAPTPTAQVASRRCGDRQSEGERESMKATQAMDWLGDQLLRINEVADCLRSSERTVRRLICSGKLRSVKVRGLRLVRASDLRALVEGAIS